MGLRHWWGGVREDLRDWRDERRHAARMAEFAADRQKFPGFDQRERALSEYFRRAPWLTADRELLPTFHGARDLQDRQEQVRLAIDAGQIPLDEKGGLLRNGASYDLNALREERERWAKAFHQEPGELGPREWSQDRTPEDHEDRVFGEMFRGSVKAGQTLYGELTPREAADWERLEHLTEQRRAAGWTGENADTPPPGREESTAAYEQLWAAMNAAERGAERGVLDTKDPTQRAISEEVLRAVERVEDAEGRGLNQPPTEVQAHRRETAEEIFQHFGFPRTEDEKLAEARGMDAEQERSDVAGLLRDHGDEVGPEEASAFARAYGIDPTEITTAEKLRNMSREELETRAEQLDQGITEAEAAAGTASDRVGDLGDWAAQARAELAAINERLVADEIEAEVAETPGADQPLVELDQLDGDLTTKADSEPLVGFPSSDDTTAATQIVDDLGTDLDRDGADTGAHPEDGMVRGTGANEPVNELEDQLTAAVDPSEQLSAEHDDIELEDEDEDRVDSQPDRSARTALEADSEPSYASHTELDHAHEAEMDW